jgi:hypothetical protein
LIKLFKRIKELFTLSERISVFESELREMEGKFILMSAQYGVEFEKKIQQMTFAYTKNLDDTKSDYLKRYLEVRMNCMQQELISLPHRIQNQMDALRLELRPDTEK